MKGVSGAPAVSEAPRGGKEAGRGAASNEGRATLTLPSGDSGRDRGGGCRRLRREELDVVGDDLQRPTRGAVQRRPGATVEALRAGEGACPHRWRRR
jgi:hypothetical protein